MSSVTRSLTLETATATDDGLEAKPTWTTTRTLTVELAPASMAQQQLAGANGQAVTHTALVPVGVALDPRKHRFTAGGAQYDLVSVTSTPRGVVAQLRKVT